MAKQQTRTWQEVSLRIRAVILVSLLAATTLSVGGQTVTVLYSFDGLNGAVPWSPQVLAQGRNGYLYGTVGDGGAFNVGTVFGITPSGNFRLLYSFTGSSDGGSSDSGLALGTDGSFYGTTYYGGSASNCTTPLGCGTIFKITPGGSLNTIYNFCQEMFCTDGVFPWSAPIPGENGSLYGTTGASTAYKISSTGGFTLLCRCFGESTSPLIQAMDGSFYGTSLTAGAYGYGSVFQVTATGNATTIYNFDETEGGLPFAPLVQGTDGNFYGSTSAGGSAAGGMVFRLTAAGDLKVLHNFDQSLGDGYQAVGGLVQATDGNLYGVTSHGGANDDGVIFKITPDGNYSILYSFDGTHGAMPQGLPMQHTNGKIYGLTSYGGSAGMGTVYSLDIGLGAFVSTVTPIARVGKSIGILGQGFTGTTNVSFNGIPATFTVGSDTFLKATVPAGATTGFVTVTTPTGTLTSNKQFVVRQ